MSNEIKSYPKLAPSGSTLYAVLRRNAGGQQYRTDTNVYTGVDSATFGNCTIPLTEQGGNSRLWYGNLPAGVASVAGIYDVDIYQEANPPAVSFANDNWLTTVPIGWSLDLVDSWVSPYVNSSGLVNATISDTVTVNVGKWAGSVVPALGSATIGYTAIAGQVNGSVTGNVQGDVIGDVRGSVLKDVSGRVLGNVNAAVVGDGVQVGHATVTTNSDKTGYALGSTGLDLVLPDGTHTLPTLICYLMAGIAGRSTGAGTGTESYLPPAGSHSFTVTFDSNSNRETVTLS